MEPRQLLHSLEVAVPEDFCISASLPKEACQASRGLPAATLHRQGLLAPILELRQRVLGADHPETIASTVNLGSL